MTVTSLILALAAMFWLSSLFTAEAADKVYLPVEAAVQHLREAMIQRRESITLYVQTDKDLRQKDVVSNQLFYPALSNYEDSRYCSGDYLQMSWRGHTASVRMENIGKWRIDFYDMKYRTTTAQEAEFDSALKSLIADLDIWTKSDALRCQAIYSYITSHVSYDYDAYSGVYAPDSARRNMSYTGYAALFSRQAVCAGYAQLFYAMAHSVGLHVRVVHGEAEGKDGWSAHAWNAVELGGLWYQLDCTWDEHDEIDEWGYFLKGANMPKHRATEPSDIQGAFSSSDYVFSLNDYMPAGRFKDVPNYDPCFEAAQTLSERGILSGTVNGYTFSPEDIVTRGMCAEVLYRMVGRPYATALVRFTDVPSDAYYRQATQWASAAGIVNGYQDGALRPNEPVSVEQLLTMLYRCYGCSSTPYRRPYKTFEIEGVAPYASEAASWAISEGIVSASLFGPTAPSEPVTRRMLAELVYAALMWDERNNAAGQTEAALPDCTYLAA